MKRIILILAFFAAAGLTACGGRKATVNDGQEASACDLFLLIGQSNMAGRGTMLAADSAWHPDGVQLLDSAGIPVQATLPLNRYSTIRKNISMQGINPGVAFAEIIREKTGRPLLLVVNARGGSALREWVPGSDYYNEAVRRTRQAMQYGTLRAILWHQGESDSGDTENYLDRLAETVAALRHDLGCGDVPFIAGEIARWHRNADRFNPMIGRIADRIPNSAFVSSEGCAPLRDSLDPHFGRDGQLLLGKRYAEKTIEMCYE
ncbi:MAG: sialate O-acetylesterase [Alistipes sp.]|nr:sialate O-acetylesterase [Alistipes sp.]